MANIAEIDTSRLPRHVAVIMDGNGRWATSRGLDRSAGHVEGVKTVRRITEAASETGIEYLTLYTFSTENWNRPKAEVDALMHLIVMAADADFEQYLTTASMPDPDLLIRTGGDHRVSNYLLWQIAYAEIYVTDTFWPDFSREDFFTAIANYQNRERRFGLTSAQIK